MSSCAADLAPSMKLRLLEDAKTLVAICDLAGPKAAVDDFAAAIDLVGAPMVWTRDLYALRGLTLRGPDSIGSSEAAVFFSTPSRKNALYVELTSRFYPSGQKGYSWTIYWNDGRALRETNERYQMTGQAFAAAARLLADEAVAAA